MQFNLFELQKEVSLIYQTNIVVLRHIESAN